MEEWFKKKRVKNSYGGSKLSSVRQKLWANALNNGHHLFITVRAFGTSVINWGWIQGSTGKFSKIPWGTTISQVLPQNMTALLVFMMRKQTCKRQESKFLLYLFHCLPLMEGRADSMVLSHTDSEKRREVFLTLALVPLSLWLPVKSSVISSYICTAKAPDWCSTLKKSIPLIIRYWCII